MISALQGLRGLAILLVFLSHWFAGARSAGFLPSEWAQILAVMNIGKYGVELFFMISGFVIAKSLERHADAVTFGIDRIARIYPVFFLLHVFVFVTGPLIHDKFFHGVGMAEWHRLFVVNALLLPGVFDFPIAQTVAWSLSYEVLFYLLAASFHHFRGRQPNRLMLAMIVLGATAFVWFHPRAIFFLPGLLAYVVYRSARWPLRGSGWVAIAALAVFFLCWHGLLPEDGRGLPALAGAGIASALLFVCALLSATFFFFQVLHDQHLLKKALESRWLVVLGEVSYSFYLLHLIVMYPVKRIVARFIVPAAGTEVAFVVFGLAALALTYGLSVLSRRWLEVQAGEFVKRSLLKARQHCSAISSSAR